MDFDLREKKNKVSLVSCVGWLCHFDTLFILGNYYDTNTIYKYTLMCIGH